MAIVMFGIGILLGFGPAFAVGYFSLSWWWIVALAAAGLIFNSPTKLYNSLRSSWSRKNLLSGVIYSVIVPIAIQSAVLSIFYVVGLWLGS
jgi:hypothetical protein